MFCSICGKENPTSAHFCSECGNGINNQSESSDNKVNNTTAAIKPASTNASQNDTPKVLREICDDFSSLDYSLLIPIKKMTDFSILSKKFVQWLLFFGIVPLLILVMHTYFRWGFEKSAWLIGAYFCAFWVAYFGQILIGDNNELIKRGIVYALFTAFIGTSVLLLFNELKPVRLLIKGSYSSNVVVQAISYILGIGVLEELCKMLPLAVLGLRKKHLGRLKDGMFLGIMSGLGFALAEVVQYTLGYWQYSAFTYSSRVYDGSLVLVQIVRFMTLPLFHAIWAGIAGWFCVAAVISTPIRKSIIVVGIGLVAVLHGLYDVFAGSIEGLLIGVVSIFIFLGYLYHSEDVPIREKLKAMSLARSNVQQ